MSDKSKHQLKVFLCHSTSDKGAVRALYRRLADDGIDVWLDEEKLLPGQDWQLEIPKAVRSSDAIIICLSRNSINKEGYIRKEIKFALDFLDEKMPGTIYLIPAKLEPCDVPEDLSRWQWVDLFEMAGYEKLMLSLQKRAKDVGAILYPKHKSLFIDKNSPPTGDFVRNIIEKLGADTTNVKPPEILSGVNEQVQNIVTKREKNLRRKALLNPVKKSIQDHIWFFFSLTTLVLIIVLVVHITKISIINYRVTQTSFAQTSMHDITQTFLAKPTSTWTNTRTTTSTITFTNTIVPYHSPTWTYTLTETLTPTITETPTITATETKTLTPTATEWPTAILARFNIEENTKSGFVPFSLTFVGAGTISNNGHSMMVISCASESLESLCSYTWKIQRVGDTTPVVTFTVPRFSFTFSLQGTYIVTFEVCDITGTYRLCDDIVTTITAK